MQKLPLEALAKYTYLSGINLSPDGHYGAYVTHTAQLEDNSYASDIWLFDALGEHLPKPLTSSGKASSFEWLPNSDKLMYASSKDPAVKAIQESGEPLTVYYTISPTGGESQEWMRIPLKVNQITPLSETLYILSAQHHSEYDRYNAAPIDVRPAILKEWKEENNFEVIEEIPFWTNGGTFLRGTRNRLYAYCRIDKVLIPLTGPDTQVSGWHYEALHDRLVAITKTFRGKAPLKSALNILDDLRATLKPIDFATAAPDILLGALQTIFPEGTHSIQYAYSLSQSQMILLAQDGSTHGLNQNAGFFSLSLAINSHPASTPATDTRHPHPASTLVPFGQPLRGTVGNSVGSDGRYGSKRNIKSIEGTAYFVTTERESAYLNRLLPDGTLECLTPTQGSVDDFDVSITHSPEVINIVQIAMRSNHLAEVYHLFNGIEAKVSKHNDWVYENHPLSTPEPISIDRGLDDFGNPFTVEGWVMRPALVAGDNEGLKLKGKAILTIHGGPKTVYGPVFYHEMQYWANLGYHILYCNPRGSDGKGDDFADIRGKYGSIDYDDIMCFVDRVLETYPEINKDALYVTGGSYGGFMTNWIVGHTDRFKAAAAQRSISNWTTEYGVTDIGYYFVPDQIGATPWSNYEALWDMSPLKYADRITTPLLLEHSDQDYRCWLPEALQMFTALKDMGKEARIIMTKGENHELSRSGKPKSRIRRIQEITSWFQKY